MSVRGDEASCEVRRWGTGSGKQAAISLRVALNGICSVSESLHE